MSHAPSSGRVADDARASGTAPAGVSGRAVLVDIRAHPRASVRAVLAWPGTPAVRRVLVRTLAGLILVLGLWDVAQIPVAWSSPGAVGIDLHTVLAGARSWLSGGGFYNPSQLAGPYLMSGATATYVGDVLYPPTMLWILVPSTALPEPLWWALPAVASALALRRLRPLAATWLVLAFLVAWPTSAMAILAGNPVIWTVGLGLLGVAYGWGSSLMLLKPSLFPFALVGITRRGWWLAVGLLALLTLPLLPLLLQYPTVILNSRGGGFLFSIGQFPLAAVPIVAWTGRSRREPAIA